MPGEAAPRHAHAVLDLPSRHQKGRKIERLLDLSGRPGPLRLLEIGTGSGGIAHYFATHACLDCQVTAVDVVDQRQVTEGYRFVQVTDTRLPFEDGSFDVVLSNHVIEHVGEASEQGLHLGEMRRVLHASGVGYLAVPNRWMLVEPHYRLAFLSWLPRSWRTPYLRMWRRGEHYDCNPLALAELERLLRDQGFAYSNLSTKALRAWLDIEGAQGWSADLAAHLPDTLLDRLAVLSPTHVYRLALMNK